MAGNICRSLHRIYSARLLPKEFVEPWPGNRSPRICETPAGMLNAIGLQNPGVENFITEAIPFLREYQMPVIVNLVGKTIEEYVAVARV